MKPTKQEMFDKGWYSFKMCERAAHCHTDEQWIKFIDECGHWYPNQGLKPFFMPMWLRKLGVNLEDPDYYDAGTQIA